MSSNNLDTLYRQVIMDHYKNPRNRGVIEDDSLTINMNNPTCGDRIQLTLKIEDDKVVDAKFQGEGCSISMSSASMMTQAIKGKPVDEALKLANTFSDMVQGKDVLDDHEHDDLILVILKHYKEFVNSQHELNVLHWLGRQWRKLYTKKKNNQFSVLTL